MRVISRRRMLEFAQEHVNAYTPLGNWYRSALGAEWKNQNDVRHNLIERLSSALTVCISSSTMVLVHQMMQERGWDVHNMTFFGVAA